MPQVRTPAVSASRSALGSAQLSYPTTIFARSAYRDLTTQRRLTPFQWQVYDAIKDLPAGRTISYGDIASAIGGSARAVGSALAKNPFSPLIPCHRVVAANGRMGGFKGATTGALVQEKVELLRSEGVEVKEPRPVFFKKAAAPTAIADGAAVYDEPVEVDGVTLNQPARILGKQTKEERTFVWRLDLFLLFYGCCSQVIKFVDQNNIKNAYVSGMKEDLSLYGKELNYFSTYFSIGYVLMLIPSQIIITYVRPSIWLPALELIWGVFTGILAISRNAQTIYALRFLIGFCEASAYPGTAVLLMTWYTPMELAKRLSFYHSAQAVGSMLSGVMQSAIIETLGNAQGIASWRWLFIINCIMTIAVATLGCVCIPDYPIKPNPWAFWLRPRHAELGLERSRRHCKAVNKPFSWQTVRNLAGNKAHCALAVALPALYVSTLLATSASSYFGVFLKSLKNEDGSAVWSLSAVNLVPVAGSAINVGVVWILGVLMDYYMKRYPVIIGAAILGLIPSIIMTVWTVPLGAKYFSYFAQYALQSTTPAIFTWLSDLLPHDAELRALLLGVAITFYYVFTAWEDPLQWPASQAPHYKHGWQICMALWVLVLVLCGFIYWLAETHIKPYNLAEAIRRADDYAPPPTIGGKTLEDDEEAFEGETTKDGKVAVEPTSEVAVLPTVAAR